MTPEWITAIIAGVGLIGGGIWGTFTYFASNKYANALSEGMKEMRREFGEFREMVTTHMANETYYRMELVEEKRFREKATEVIKSSEEIFLRVEKRLNRMAS